MKKRIADSKLNVFLVNRFTNEVVECDIFDEEEIEGKKFFVAKTKNRILKFSKDAYSIKKSS